MFDYSSQVYRVEDISILVLSKVIQLSPNLPFRNLNEATYGNVFDLPLPLHEQLLHVPRTLPLEGLCPPSTPACSLPQAPPVVQICLRSSGKLLEVSVLLQAKLDKQQLENKTFFGQVHRWQCKIKTGDGA